MHSPNAIVVFPDCIQLWRDCDPYMLENTSEYEVIRESSSRYLGTLLRRDMGIVHGKDMCEVIEEDCLRIFKEIPTNSVDLIVTSPPRENYNFDGVFKAKLSDEDYLKWALPRYLECERVSRGCVVWVITDRSSKGQGSSLATRLMVNLRDEGLDVDEFHTYRRPYISANRLDCYSEHIIYSVKYTIPHFKDIMEFMIDPEMDRIVNNFNSNEDARFEFLVERYVANFCNPKGLLLDPFCGSGTALDVALRNGRGAIGLDMRKAQVELATKRVTKKRRK